MSPSQRRALDLLVRLAEQGGAAVPAAAMPLLSPDQRQRCAALAARAGLVRRDGPSITLTETGRAAATKLGGH